jgi:hypothetical protein
MSGFTIYDPTLAGNGDGKARVKATADTVAERTRFRQRKARGLAMISTSTSRPLLSARVRSLGTGAGLLLALAGSPAFATTELVANGDFTVNGGNGQLGFNSSAAGWTVPTSPNPPPHQPPTAFPNSYWFVFNAQSGTTSGTSADNSGAPGWPFDGFPNTVKLWGPGTGSANGLTLSPNGGAFVGSDPAFINHPMTQTLTGLRPGVPVIVTFDWAAATQSPFDAPMGIDAGWKVSLGGESFDTGLAHAGNHGFSGWMPATFTFTPTSSSETLSFMSIGTPIEALPPFALLDSVSAREIPELSTWAMMALGFAGLAYAGFRSNRQKPAWSD